MANKASNGNSQQKLDYCVDAERSAQSEKKKMTAEIKKGINENKNTFELRDVIIGFKKKGGSQKEAHEILEKIRFEFEANENKEDKVLELLDFVCGWCQKEFRIWKEIKIFYSEQDEITKRYIVIEEDENSIWVYLTIPNESQIDKDCFLGSRYEIKEDISNFKEYKKRQIPLPMTKAFSTEFSFFKEINEDDLTVNWFQNGNVLLTINGNPFLFFHHKAKRGFSKSIKKDGMYGNSWSESKYKEIL